MYATCLSHCNLFDFPTLTTLVEFLITISKLFYTVIHQPTNEMFCIVVSTPDTYSRGLQFEYWPCDYLDRYPPWSSAVFSSEHWDSILN